MREIPLKNFTPTSKAGAAMFYKIVRESTTKPDHTATVAKRFEEDVSE